jgi:hypothetical protein
LLCHGTCVATSAPTLRNAAERRPIRGTLDGRFFRRRNIYSSRSGFAKSNTSWYISYIVGTLYEIYTIWEAIIKNKKLFILVFVFSIYLFIIGIIYSKQPGFIIGHNTSGDRYYSTEIMSSGGDDFYIFQLNTILNINIATLSSLFMGLNIVFKKALHKLFIILFFFLWILELAIIFLINLDISLIRSILYGDYLLLFWLILFFAQIPCIIIIQRQKEKTTYNSK